MHISSKTIARLAVIQTIYLVLFNNNTTHEDAVEQIINYYSDQKQITNDLQPPPDTEVKLNIKYYKNLLSLYINNNDNAETILNEFFSYKKKEIPVLLKILIQAGVTELTYLDTPYKIVINEYTNIASEFFVEHYVGFVNLALDKLSPKEKSS